MKLLTTGGLLYTTAQAQRPNGTQGTYQDFDYVAMFPEGANGGYNLSTATYPINVGWDPMVVEVISNYDGGKTIAGFGKITGTMYGSWVIKMWGSTGAINCGDAAKITGYVTMKMILGTELSAASNCVLASGAYVQWAWSNVISTFLTTTTQRVSYVITSATEEWKFGQDTPTTVGANAYIIVAGGKTSDSWEAYGMNSWTFTGQFIDFDGKDATAAALANPDTVPFLIASQNVAANTVYYDDVGSTKGLLNAPTAMNHCWTAVHGHPNAVTAMRAVIGGYIGSITTCLKHAVDGYSFWGANIIAKVGKDWVGTAFDANNSNYVVAETAAQTQMQSQIGTRGGGGQAGINLAQVRVIHVNYLGADYDGFILLTTSEYYYQSVLFSQLLDGNINVAQGGVALVKGTYGSAWNFWPFKNDEATAATRINAQDPNNVIMVGVKTGKGVFWRATLINSPLAYGATDTSIITANATSGIATVDAPLYGVGQFKGTTLTDNEKLYVQTICLGVQPMYYTTWAIALDDGVSNGWVLSCYTGIPQCSVSLADAITVLDNATSTQTASCMNDPRYMTWRVMTMKVDKNGTVSWYRVDSYWDSTSTMFSSTWGVGVRLSTNVVSDDDNYGTTNLGKTFVFAYSDGSGVQLNHIAFGTSPVASNSTAGAGTVTLTTAPATFSNTSPDMFNQNYCSGSNLALSGTADTSSLSTTITDYSDGYLATITLNLEYLLPGAAGGWRGVCVVYYSSQYVMDNTNGSICFAAQADSATGKGPTDFGAGFVMSVAASVWQPPMNKASLQPSSAALTGGKYGITYAPSASTAYMYTEGYYASVTWYQPKYASSYTGEARYGKDDYVGAFCMQGHSSNSYFSSTTASQKLSGAMYLAVGAVSAASIALAI